MGWVSLELLSRVIVNLSTTRCWRIVLIVGGVIA
jgi:hypothetical protein